MNTQFKHHMSKKRTYAIDVPWVHQVERSLNEFINTGVAYLSFEIGMARLHPLDQFCKRTGRMIAVEKMKMEIFEIDHVYMNRSKSDFLVINRHYEVRFRFVRNFSNDAALYVLDVGKKGDLALGN